LRRQLVTGGDEELARRIRRVDPAEGTLPWQVHTGGKAALRAHIESPDLLGVSQDGVPLVMQLGVTSVLSVPIRDTDDSHGALTLARRGGPFSMADLALIEDIGEHLGVAIRVDRLFRHRSAVAEALQASLLPGTLPSVAGLELSAAYLPAGSGLEVSGDFYDVFPVPGQGCGITIGDVCGKGPDAAAMTAAARHAIRVLGAFTTDPAEVLVKTNDMMLSGDYEDRFVTAQLAYLKWEKNRLRVRLASAGHPGPALVRADGRVELLSGGGLPLGLFPDASPGLETLLLRTGDMLFFFSDGVTDARGADLAYFEERLADELAGLAGRSAGETARAVQGALVSFAADELRDDATILVARVTSQPAGSAGSADGQARG
jgi:serine phosphatase RsbU (regulator of sigma subunit)